MGVFGNGSASFLRYELKHWTGLNGVKNGTLTFTQVNCFSSMLNTEWGKDAFISVE